MTACGKVADQGMTMAELSRQFKISRGRSTTGSRRARWTGIWERVERSMRRDRDRRTSRIRTRGSSRRGWQRSRAVGAAAVRRSEGGVIRRQLRTGTGPRAERAPRGAARDQPLDHAHADDRTGARWFELDPAMPTAGTEPVVGLLPTGGRERADAGVTSAIIALRERKLRRAFRQASGAYGSSETLWSSRTVCTPLRLARILIAAGVASTATVRKALTSSSSRRPPHFARTWSKSIRAGRQASRSAPMAALLCRGV